MNKTFQLSYLLAFGIPFVMVMLMIVLVKSPWFMEHPGELSPGITFDLVLTIPLIYFLLIRKTAIPRFTVIPLFITGILVAGMIIPSDHQFFLTQVKKWILPAVELMVLTVVMIKLYRTRQLYRIQKGQAHDFFTALRNAASEVLPKRLSTVFTTEIAVFYYGFAHWKKGTLRKNEFSYHKDSGTQAVLGAIIFLVISETFVFHILLQTWSETAAWVLSGLSVYSGLQVFGLMRSMSKRPIVVANEYLELRYGIFGEATIPLKEIKEVKVIYGELPEDKKIIRLCPMGSLESPNMVLHLRSDQVLHRFYGLRKVFSSIAFYVDEKERLESSLKDHVDPGK